MKHFLFISFITLLTMVSNPVFSETSIKDLEYRAMTESFLGFEEDNSTYHFERACSYYKRLIATVNTLPDSSEKTELLRKYTNLLSINCERISSFALKLRNAYPYLHFATSLRDFRETYKDSDNIAIEKVTSELMDITTRAHERKGQIGILIMGNNAVPRKVIDHAMTFIQKKKPYGPYLQDEFYNFLGRFITMVEVWENPDILKPLLEKEGLEYLFIFAFNKEKGLGTISHYTGKSLMYDSKNPGKLTTLAISDGFGQNTSGIERKAGISLAKAITEIMLFSLILYIMMIKFLEQGNIRENMKPMIILGIILVAGLGMGPGYESLVSRIFSDLQGPTGLQWLYFLLLGAGFIILSVAAIMFLLMQFEGYFVLSRNQFYLPSLMFMLFSGLGTWFLYRLRLFLEIYPGTEATGRLWFLIPALAIPGIFIGIALQRIMNRKHITSGRIASAIIYLVAGIGLLTHNLERITAVNIDGFMITALSSLLLVLIVEPAGALIGRKIEENREPLPGEKSVIFPKTIDELARSCESPVFIDPLVQGDSLLAEAGKNLLRCLNVDDGIEGGVLHVLGCRGSGKSRLVNELLSLSDFSRLKIIRLVCEKPSQGDEKPFAPFINGLKEIQDVHSLEEAYRMNSIIRDSSGKLHEPMAEIPLIGPLISFILRTDTSRFTEKSDESAIIHRIALRLTLLSRSLIRKSEKEQGESPGMIFVVENYQDIDPASRLLLSRIQDYLMDDILSPEKNPVAFILVETRESLYHEKFPEMKNTLYIEVPGLDITSARNLFFNSLNFSPAGKTVLSVIFRRYGHDAMFILPRELLDSVKAVADRRYLRESERGFIPKSEISNDLLPLPPAVRTRWREKLFQISREDQDLLELAAVMGTEFKLSSLTVCLDSDEGDVLRRLNRIEEETGYIEDYSREKDLFRFSSRAARDVVIERLNLARESSFEAKQLLEFYHTLVYTRVYMNMENPTIEDKIDAAFHASQADSSYRDKAVDLNIGILIELHLRGEDFNLAAKHLALLLGLLDSRKRGEYDVRLVPVCAWILQNGRDIVLVDHPVIGEYCRNLAGRCSGMDNITASHASSLAELAFILGDIPATRDIWTLDILRSFASCAMNSAESNSLEKAWGSFWLASAEKISGHNDRCLEYLDISDRHLTGSRNNDLHLESRVINTRAEVLFFSGDHDTARRFFNEALNLKVRIKDRQGMAMIFSFLAEIENKAEKYSFALDNAQKCLDLNHEMDNDFGIGIALKLKAEILTNMAKLTDARKCHIDRLHYVEGDRERIRSMFDAAIIDMKMQGKPGDDLKRHLRIYLGRDADKKKALDEYIKGIEDQKWQADSLKILEMVC